MTEIEPNIDIAQLYARTKKELTIETVLIGLLKEMNQAYKQITTKTSTKQK